MTNPYDMIERLMAMQTAPADWNEYHASQETIKDAVQVIGELVDQVERLQAGRELAGQLRREHKSEVE